MKAFLWTPAAGMIALAGENWGLVDARAISADGTIVAGMGYRTDTNQEGAAIWTAEEGIQFLSDLLAEQGVADLDQLDLLAINAISDDGRTMVGYAAPSANHGYHKAYVATLSPVPIPAAAWLFGSALVGLNILRRRPMKDRPAEHVEAFGKLGQGLFTPDGGQCHLCLEGR